MEAQTNDMTTKGHPMKKNLISASLALLFTLMLVTVATADEAKAPAFKTFEEKFAYAIGVEMGTNLNQNAIEVDLDALMKGMSDGYKGNEPVMTKEEMVQIRNEGIQKLRAKAQAKRIKDTADNLATAEKFLADNKTKKGVKTTKSGLQYEVITKGTGDMPKATDQVTVHYRGTLLNGTEFDSSYSRNTPATFSVGGVIPGWVEALQMMKTGAKWKLYVPPALAYGDRGTPNGTIGPNELLTFEVELLEIAEPAQATE